MIRITSRKAGFRRCGIPHPAQAVEYPDDRFSADELAVLQAEPMLTVEIVPDPPVTKGDPMDEENDETIPAAGKMKKKSGPVC